MNVCNVTQVLSMLRGLASNYVFTTAIMLCIANFNASFGQEKRDRQDQPAIIVVQNAVGMKLVKIPAGEFLMGSHESGTAIKEVFPEEPRPPTYFQDELPQHRVRMTKPFLMGKTEVTVGQFRQFAEESGYRVESERDGTGGWGFNPEKRVCEGRFTKYDWRSPGFEQTEDHPVLNVTWNDAIQYCKWLTEKTGQTYRLPTEAEWEYACRAGSTNRYGGFDDIHHLSSMARTVDVRKNPNFAHIQDLVIPENGSIQFPAPVGSYPANAWGLHDMHGNVWEWTNDWYSETYYAESPSDDPKGPPIGGTRVRRGGAWNSVPIWSRSSFRNWNSDDSRCSNLGFRVVAELKQVDHNDGK